MKEPSAPGTGDLDRPGESRGGKCGPASLVSVIVPNFNHGHLVHAAIDSLAGQSRAPDEIIVVDDGSTDGSLVTIERARRRFESVRILTHDSNRGVVAALNTGLAAARGELVLLAAADDWYDPEFIGSAVALLERHPHAGMACGEAVVPDPSTGRVRQVRLPFGNEPRRVAGAEVVAALRRRNFLFTGGATVLRRQAVDEVGGLRPELRWHSDWFLNFAVSVRHGLCYLARPAVRVHVSGTSYSAGRRDAERQRQVIEELVRAMRSPGLEDVYAALRRGAALPTFEPRVLRALLARPSLRDYLTPLLAWRLGAYPAASWLGGLFPPAARDALRPLIRM